MLKKNTIPTILGVIILVLGTVAGVFLIRNTSVFKIGADASVAAKNIRVSNISDSSATITWTTDKPTSGFIIWGTSEGSLNRTENEDSTTQKYYSHSVNLSGLSASGKYFYKINSEGSTFDNGGIPWQFTTGTTLSSNKDSVLLSGSVINASGTAEKRALIYADIGGYLLSTLTSDTGNFVFQIASARTADLSNYVQIDPAQTLIQISVQAPPDGVASAQIFPQSANPVPPIIIGQTYDFRNEPINNQGANPGASLNLPQDTTKQSKIDISIPSQTPKPTSVILESISEGETITTNKPQFFGKGPSGTTLTITVHSDQTLSGNIQIPKTGSWQYAVPANLSPGTHTITISWVDVTGITRFLTRDFVVQASDAPSFTASQSGSTPTPTAVPTVAPSSSPSTAPVITATPIPTKTPSPTPAETAMPVPVTGDLTPTLLLFIMGLVVMTFSFVVWKVAEN